MSAILMKICFLDNSPIPYNSNDLNSKDIRGAENVIIHLSNELTKLNEVETFLTIVRMSLSDFDNSSNGRPELTPRKAPK